MSSVPVDFFFNFRSPYCYLISKKVFEALEPFHVELNWRPLGGWDGRSPPERAKKKIPLVRQDIARWCERLGVPMNPPPITTDPTRAGAASLYTEKQGRLREFVVETMPVEWAEGRDIGESDVLAEVARRIGLDAGDLVVAADDPDNRATLEQNQVLADAKGIFGVPTFVIGDQLFWGNDRLDFVVDELRKLRAARW